VKDLEMGKGKFYVVCILLQFKEKEGRESRRPRSGPARPWSAADELMEAGVGKRAPLVLVGKGH
jgi:hypothetical protein